MASAASGASCFRAAVQNFATTSRSSAINDLLEPDVSRVHAQATTRCTAASRATAAVDGNTLVVNGQNIRLSALKDPAALNWSEVGADVVIESTGLFLDEGSRRGSTLAAGAKKVIMSAPSKDDTPMFVYGVNDKTYAGQTDHLATRQCTTNCLAPSPRC